MYHLEGLPPVCLLHGVDDELSPFSQSVQLAEELERRGVPYEFCACQGLSHDSTSAGNASANWRAVARQILRGSLDCLHLI